MATERLATGSGAATSSDVTITSDTLFSLKGATSGSYVDIEAKDDASAYNVIGRLSQDKPAGILAAGTYRFSRFAGSTCGVFSA